MDKTKQEAIFATFPHMFRQRKRVPGKPWWPIAFGIECDDGWYDLIMELTLKIGAMDKARKVEVHQIKEKFGGLRYYINGGPIMLDFMGGGSYQVGEIDDVRKLINRYQDKSFDICETCGAPGKICTTGNWLKTVCRDHREFTNWAGRKLTYKPCRFYSDYDPQDLETLVITPDGISAHVLKAIFNEDQDQWVYTTDKGVFVQTQLKRVKRRKLWEGWQVKNTAGSKYWVERLSHWNDKDKCWVYETTPVNDPHLKCMFQEQYLEKVRDPETNYVITREKKNDKKAN